MTEAGQSAAGQVRLRREKSKEKKKSKVEEERIELQWE